MHVKGTEYGRRVSHGLQNFCRLKGDLTVFNNRYQEPSTVSQFESTDREKRHAWVKHHRSGSVWLVIYTLGVYVSSLYH